MTLGMPRTPRAAAISGFSSELIFTSTTWPASSCSNRSSTGASARHGPHQGAQKSTRTGVRWEAASTSTSKFCWVTSIIVDSTRRRRDGCERGRPTIESLGCQAGDSTAFAFHGKPLAQQVLLHLAHLVARQLVDHQ